jgi:predicted nucleic-acid-binding protein
MIGLDTNVLLRCFVDDDPAQSKQARQFVAQKCTPESPGFVDRVVLCELVWVLSRGYGYTRAEIVKVLDDLIATRDVVLEDQDLVRKALRSFETGRIGFADALIGEVNRARGCQATATFDQKAARLEMFLQVG